MENVLTVGIKYPDIPHYELNSSLKELELLVATAGGKVVQTVVQNRVKPDPAFLIGKGKVEEIAQIVRNNKNIKTVAFDDEITPAQQRNLEETINTKIITRTKIILDIFGYRARTKEGILQVELARLNYDLPRLNRKGIWLDSQAGGIGTRRGPGEKKLEYDKRVIRDKISELKHEIDFVRKHREIQRLARKNDGVTIVSLAGYTNAGKSTFLNAVLDITGQNTSKVYADNKLFATLDTTIRRVKLPSGKFALFIDTVGFIRKLPHQIIAAFRATLEEITESQYILHLIDINSPDYARQEQIVTDTLREIKCENIPLIKVYNKYDLVDIKPKDNNFYISAKTGYGINNLLHYIDKLI